MNWEQWAIGNAATRLDEGDAVSCPDQSCVEASPRHVCVSACRDICDGYDVCVIVCEVVCLRARQALRASSPADGASGDSPYIIITEL